MLLNLLFKGLIEELYETLQKVSIENKTNQMLLNASLQL